MARARTKARSRSPIIFTPSTLPPVPKMEQPTTDLSAFSAALMQPAAMGVASYILTNFFPDALSQFIKHPRLTRLLSFVVAMWALGPYVYEKIMQLWYKISSYATTTITVNSSDVLFEPMLRWVSNRKTYHDQTRFTVWSHLKRTSVQPITRKKEEMKKVGGWFDRLGNEYEPDGGYHVFFFRRNLFIMDKSFSSFDHHITLTCLGRSSKPIADMMEEVMRIYQQSKSLYTVVHRANHGCWAVGSEKPQRAMESVNIDAGDKERLLADLDEYVAGKSAEWYAARCVPYRRGYLFYGPPGTGKSSFAMAIAAHYQCDIYMMSLLDKNMYDHNLLNLFNDLPPRALVLLEDIDSAGLKRELKKSRKQKEASQVTLSGLLNAIDGVDSPEGHILIMTSNAPEELDDALVRSGRISVKVGFKKSSPAQAREIFMRMYRDDVTDPEVAVTRGELEQLGNEFSKRLPDNEFSPADLQDFMLVRKSDPRRAVAELPDWVAQLRKERADELELKRKKKEERMKLAERERLKNQGHTRGGSREDESYYSHSGETSDGSINTPEIELFD